MEEFKRKFIQNFIEDDRYELLLDGLLVTLEISFLSVLIGIVIGFIIAIIRATHDKTGKLKFFNILAKIYITVIRGTPILVQLLIAYYVIFTAPNVSKIFVAVMAFGINSGAYVSEIIRAGIESIDKGQMEAGRSLGLGYFQTLKLKRNQTFLYM